MMINDNVMLPMSCCKVVEGDPDDKGIQVCGKLACHWYMHNGDICSYCEEHNYACGEKIDV